jgi:hypothetical protein
VPAVIAMQDNISMKSVAVMPAFFEALQRDGLVDRALAARRAALARMAQRMLTPALLCAWDGSIWK